METSDARKRREEREAAAAKPRRGSLVRRLVTAALYDTWVTIEHAAAWADHKLARRCDLGGDDD